MSDEKYNELFPDEKAKEVLKVAIDIRKCEIDLYW